MVSILIWFCIFVCSGIILALGPKEGAASLWLNVTFGTAVLFFILWLWLGRHRRKRNWFHPVVFFTISYLVVCFQIPWCISHEYEVPSFCAPFPDLINYCASISLMGLASFYFGDACSQYVFRKKQKRKNAARLICYEPGIRKVSRDMLVICIGLNLLFFGLAGKGLYLNFIYDGGLSWGVGATYVNVILFLMTSFLTAIEAVRLSNINVPDFKEYILKYDRRILYYLAISSLPYLLSGERGSLIAIGFSVVAPYFLFHRPMKGVYFVLLLFVSSIFLTFLGDMRTRDSSVTWNERIDKGKSETGKFSIEPNKWVTMDLAASYRCFNAAVEVVPDEYDYANGRFLLGSISALIPFFERLFPINTDHYIGKSSLFFTNLLRDGDMTSGEGSAVLGASYLDFGVYGIPAVMFLLGYLMNLTVFMSQRRYDANAVLWVFIYIYALFQAVKLPRSDPFFWVQNVGWGTLVYFVFLKPYMKKNKAFRPLVRRGVHYS